MKGCCILWVAAGGLLAVQGCCSLLPETEAMTRSRFENYAQVSAAFEAIVPYQTRTTDLEKLGFEPSVSPNVKVLTYVQAMEYFMPNPSVTNEDLSPPVGGGIDAKENWHAYPIELSDIRTKRHGNVVLDILGFKRRTLEAGWRFAGIIPPRMQPLFTSSRPENRPSWIIEKRSSRLAHFKSWTPRLQVWPVPLPRSDKSKGPALPNQWSPL